MLLQCNYILRSVSETLEQFVAVALMVHFLVYALNSRFIQLKMATAFKNNKYTNVSFVHRYPLSSTLLVPLFSDSNVSPSESHEHTVKIYWGTLQ